jgi:hypothetical protein
MLFYAHKLLSGSFNRIMAANILTKLPHTTSRFYGSAQANKVLEKAASDLKKLQNEPDDDAKLQLYGLFKQVIYQG